MNQLASVRLGRLPEPIRTGASVPLHVVIENTSPTAICIDERALPTAHDPRNVLTVSLNGRIRRFKGGRASRSRNFQSWLVVLPAGETAQWTVPLDALYDVTDDGLYVAQLKSPIPIAAIDRVVIPPNGFTDLAWTVVANVDASGWYQTSAPADRGDKSLLQTEAIVFTEGAPLRPEVDIADTAKAEFVLHSHAAAYELAKRAIGALGNVQLFTDWFGAPNSSRVQTAERVFRTVVIAMEQTVFSYRYNGFNCPGNFAYIEPGSTRVTVCPTFLATPTSGHGSAPGLVLHEHTHMSAHTDDIAATIESCRKLAAKNPQKALRNAYNYQFFAESV